EAFRRRHVITQESLVEHTGLLAVREKPVHQGHVTAWPQLQVKIGLLASLGPTRVDDHQSGTAALAGGYDPLIDHRMTPGRVRSYQHDQIGLVEIVVAPGDDILPEGAEMARDRTRHAQP